MSAIVRRRERIARVRRIQHAEAATGASAAELQLAHLERSEGRLTELRASLATPTGAFSAETLASRAELALRLDEARFGLIPTIADARATAALRTEERIAARRNQEAADKLAARAAEAEAARAERRLAAAPRSLRREA